MGAGNTESSLLRHSYRYGYPAVAYIDLGPGLVKGARHKVDLSNHSTLLRQSCGMRVIPKPPQAHEQRGKVERVVRALKEWIQNEELSLMTQSILDWETTFAHISNFFNNLPMARLSKEPFSDYRFERDCYPESIAFRAQ